MMHIALRKTSSSPIASGRALSAAALGAPLRRPRPLAAPSGAAAAAAVEPGRLPAAGGILRRPRPRLGSSSARGFHASPGPLGFRASGASRAESTADDFYRVNFPIAV